MENKKIDTIRFVINFKRFPGETDESGSEQLAIEAFINDQKVANWFDFPIDIISLLESSEKGGNYFIRTCTCGIPNCAGIHKKIFVVHEKETILWKYLDKPLEDFKELIFDKEIYKKEITTLWKNFRGTYILMQRFGRQIEFCPDLKADEIMNLLRK